jgi:hypothetical protein
MQPRFEQELRRRGRRGAYKLETRYWELEHTTPRHGSRPFEVAHLDHTVADLVLVTSNGQVQVVGRNFSYKGLESRKRPLASFPVILNPERK